MLTEAQLAEQLREIGYAINFIVRPLLREIANCIENDEKVVGLMAGSLGSPAVLVATDKRILFFQPGVWRHRCTYIAYNTVLDVSLVRKFLTTTLTLKANHVVTVSSWALEIQDTERLAAKLRKFADL